LTHENQLVNAFFMQYNKAAGKRGIFTSYTLGTQILNARITSDDDENVVMREADDPTTRKLAVSAAPPKYRVRPVVVTRQTTTEAGALNDIWFDPRAAAKYALACQNGFTAADSAGGLSANMQVTEWRRDLGSQSG
jgi:hypothetical protein